MPRVISILLLLTWASSPNAALVISDVSGSVGQLSLTVSGTVEAEHLNSLDTNVLYFGFDNGGDDSWIGNVDETGSTSLAVQNGGSITLESAFGYPGYGGYVAALFFDEITAGTVIDYSFTWVGDFDFSVYSTSDLVAQVGNSGINPAIVGGTNAIAGSAVPIPAGAWLFCSALAGLGWIRRKRNS